MTVTRLRSSYLSRTTLPGNSPSSSLAALTSSARSAQAVAASAQGAPVHQSILAREVITPRGSLTRTTAFKLGVPLSRRSLRAEETRRRTVLTVRRGNRGQSYVVGEKITKLNCLINLSGENRPTTNFSSSFFFRRSSSSSSSSSNNNNNSSSSSNKNINKNTIFPPSAKSYLLKHFGQEACRLGWQEVLADVPNPKVVGEQKVVVSCAGVLEVGGELGGGAAGGGGTRGGRGRVRRVGRVGPALEKVRQKLEVGRQSLKKKK